MLNVVAMQAGALDVMGHKWFRGIDWHDVRDTKLEPPIVPTLYSEGDTGNFDAYEEQRMEDFPEAPDSELEMFRGF